jgi:hypothetical protein
MSAIYYGGIFNFTDSYYVPPALLGGTYNFTKDLGFLRQIYSDSQYVYLALSDKLGINDIVTEERIAYLNYTEGFNTVTGNSSRVYLGTASSGIKYINISTISGSVSLPTDLSIYLEDLVVPNITSNNIRYLSVKEDRLLACTNSGVDYFNSRGNPTIHSKTLASGTQKCFVTDKYMYYTVSGTDPVT